MPRNAGPQSDIRELVTFKGPRVTSGRVQTGDATLPADLIFGVLTYPVQSVWFLNLIG